MWESFFGFKKTPFSDSPDAKQLFASQAWNQVKTRLEFLAQHHGVGLITGEVGAGKSTAARVFTAALNTSLYKILYVHFSSGSALDLLRQIALELDLAQQLKAAGVSQPLFDDTARQGLYQATKGIPRKVNKLAMTALRLAAASKSQTVSEAILLDAAAEAML